ncbi:MAG: sigma 54-interacting transcriptional regulator, partial [Clostridia bacterium]|nr:sigma 54-interacting transcriptional regulator [Clostridia bacterium]
KEIKRVGGIRVVPVDVRIIAASNRDLEDMVRKKEFREDLYYRLSVVPINIPPLRERRDDLLPLIAHFLNRYNAKYGTNKNISPSALDCLIDYHWPGNVRELENTIERLVLVSNGDTIQHGDLPEKIKRASAPCEHVGEEIKPLKAAIEDLEKRLIRRALDVCPTVGEAARALGVDMSTLTRKRQKYRLL